jgi:ferredoxin
MKSNDQNDGLPTQPTAIKDGEASKRILHTLRHFHLGNPAVRDQLESLEREFLPALLAPYRDTSRLRYDYPLFLYPADVDEGDREGGDLARPVSRFLVEAVASFAPTDGDARMLKDNLLRLEQALRQRLEDQDTPVAARPLLMEVSAAMLEQLALDEESNVRLQADLDRMLQAVPEEGQFLAYGRHPAIHLLIHVIRCRVIPRHALFQSEVQASIRGLQLLLDVEREKSDEAMEPAAVKESIGLSARLFDPEALSKVMDHSRGSIGMSPLRRQRVEGAMKTLRSYREEPTLVRFVHLEGLDSKALLGDIPGFEAVSSADPCVQAKELFDQEAARLAKIFAAVRIARLEIEDLYDESIHDPWFENFNWEAFSQQELLLVPAVIALETAQRVAGEAMPVFSRLLNSGRPVQILVRVLGHANPGRDTEEEPFAHFRTELGYLGIAHRQAVVCQTSAARHEHLLHQFTTALDTTRTGLHLINVGLRPTGQDLGLNGWLVAGAALEGRVHPFFQINPSAGDSFADRMDFIGNPQPERDWPIHLFSYRDESSEQVDVDLAFTFADYALLIPRLHRHFTPVPLVCESDSLVPIADYLAMPEEESAEQIPFVWAVSDQGELRQLAVTRTLVHACRDRLNFWHTLQEMAGVRSRYLELGIARAREEITAEAGVERQRLIEVHLQELEQERAEAAAGVMGRLTEMLMGMDLTGGAPRLPAAAPAAPVVSAAAAQPPESAVEPEPAPAIEEEDEPVVADPWIDSGLCTSCNDCLVINPQVFVYNDDNQAYIAGAGAGTFAQMVEAAEICPAKCIHPGQPLNPGEPGLEALIERAAPFN